MNPLIQDLVERIDHALKNLDVDARNLAKEVGQDLAKLGMRRALGDDVDEELAHVRAQALNLSVAAQQVVAQSLIEWAQGLMAGVLRRVLGVV